MPDLKALFQPGAIAVVGASSKPGSFGGQVLQNLKSLGYHGALYGVHPREREIFGLPAYPSLADIPHRPDCIALAVANRHLMGLLEQAASLEIPAAVLFGDPSVGPDRDPGLQSEIVAYAAEHGILVCGPNSMGLISRRAHLGISGYPLQADMPSGNIALITHSGTVFDSISQNNREVYFNYLISGGNEACLTAADYLEYVIGDPDTKVVALYLETVRDPQKFTRALATARRVGIPVVVLKTGRSRRGQELAQAHSGALSGSARAYAAVFRRYGARQVETLDEMMDTLELFSRVQAVRSGRLSVLMESGGERSMLVDIAEDLGLELSRLSESTRSRLAEIVDLGVPLENPLDAFGSGHQVVQVYRACLKALDADPETGLNLLAVDLARFSNLSPAYVQAVLGALPELANPLAALVNLTSGANESLMADLRSQGVPVLMGTETGLKAVRHLVAYSEFNGKLLEDAVDAGRPGEAVVRQVRAEIEKAGGPIGEHASLQLLSLYGLPVAPTLPAGSLAQALEAAGAIGYPVALKTAEPGQLHKTEVHGVRLGLSDPASLEAAYRSLSSRLGSRVVVQQMAPDGVEMFFGMSSDRQFGPLLLFGLGGVNLEVYQDVVAALPGFSWADAEKLLRTLQGFPLLAGWRGGPAADLDQLAGWMVRFSTFIRDVGDLLAEADLNPLIVSAGGGQIVDALLVPRLPRDQEVGG